MATFPNRSGKGRGCYNRLMRTEELVFGLLCVIWGAFSLVWRREILSLAREGAKGLRDPRLLKPLLFAASSLLMVVGVFLLLRGLKLC